MASFSTTKVFAGMTTLTPADLDAIVAQLSAALGLITDRTAAGATVDGDVFLVGKAGQLQQMTAAQIKFYLGQVFVPSQFSVNTALTIPTGAPAGSPTWSQQLGNITLTTVVARKGMGWLSCSCIPLAGCTAIAITVIRQDGVGCGSFQFQFPGAISGTNAWPICFMWVDGTTLGAATTYYCQAKGIGASCTVNDAVLSFVQM